MLEDSFDSSIPRVQPIIAAYASEPGSEPDRNPLILALPAIKSDIDWLDQLTRLPAFDPSQLADEAYVRSYYVAGLKDFFVPSERSREVARRIDQLIRHGLKRYNPLAADHYRLLQNDYNEAQRTGKASRVVYSKVLPICSYSLIGVSGMGKSTTVESILAAYPQYIFHPRYDLHQVVWLKVECPRDGSMKELALNILRAFNAALGTAKALRDSSRVTVDMLMNEVKVMAQAHCLGILILDELQNVSIRKSGGREELLNWFQELVNEFKLPLMVLGTFKARSVLQLDVRHSRRAGVMGSSTWRPLQRGSEYDLLIESLWEYQWLRQSGPLTDEFKDMVYAETQGVVAFMVDMFLVCQLHALNHEKEALTPEMFRDVARREFEFLQPVLNALRSKQPNRLAKFEDVDSYDMDDIIERHQRLLTQAASARKEDSSGPGILGRAAAMVRSALGISERDARALVESVCTPAHKSHSRLTQDAVLAWAKRQGGQPPTDGHADPA